MSKKYTGQCACGQLTYGFDTEPTFVANCHCTDCKRASGGEMATIALEPREVDAAARLPTIRPRAQLNGKPRKERGT